MHKLNLPQVKQNILKNISRIEKHLNQNFYLSSLGGTGVCSGCVDACVMSHNKHYATQCTRGKSLGHPHNSAYNLVCVIHQFR